MQAYDAGQMAETSRIHATEVKEKAAAYTPITLAFGPALDQYVRPIRDVFTDRYLENLSGMLELPDRASYTSIPAFSARTATAPPLYAATSTTQTQPAYTLPQSPLEAVLGKY